MPKLSDLAVRMLSPAGYRFSTGVVKAVTVRSSMLEDNLVDFDRFKPEHREALENDLLHPNDIVLGFTGIEREVTSVGLYHPALSTPEPVTLSPFTIAFRALNLSQATSILAGVIYRLNSRRNLSLGEIRAMEINPLTDEQVRKFLELLKTAHEMRVNMRKRDALMRELIPATIAKFFNDNKEPEEIKL
jgi:tRNA C32,U32 (ribose-2'-O)-methylase TrmJ